MLWFFASIAIFVGFCRFYKYSLTKNKETTIGFFHPFSNGLGGGERVLWQGIRALLLNRKDLTIIVYSGEESDDVLKNVKERFHIDLAPFQLRLKFRWLRLRPLIDPSMYPRFTMLLQSIGAMILALEALFLEPCDIFFDSTGFASTFPIAFCFGAKIAAYVHYPTISSDMLQKVSVSDCKGVEWFIWAKLVYYHLFAFLYGICGRFAHTIMVNSSWTKAHIIDIWGRSVLQRVDIVYPPCDVDSLTKFPLNNGFRNLSILSVGQFRPEKDHKLQIKAFHQFLEKHAHKFPNEFTSQVKLVLVGGARNKEDYERVEDLHRLSIDLEIADRVDIIVNAPYRKLEKLLTTSIIGLHTMWNEHFGICVAEFMAAGMIVLAHNSGGPKSDIVQDEKHGFLASSVDEFAEKMDIIFTQVSNSWNDPDAIPLKDIRLSARSRVKAFSNSQFEEHFVDSMKRVY